MASVYKRGGRRGKGNYYIDWYDHTGKRRSKSSGTSDKAAANRIAAKIEADVALRREGVIDPTLDAITQQARRSIKEHLADFENKMRAAGRSQKHIRSTRNFVEQISGFADFAVASDINADGVYRYATSLQEQGRAARTVQAHLNAITAFTRWLTEQMKLPRDPLAGVKKPNPKNDRRLVRRMLLPKEWSWLKAVTEAGPELRGMSALERATLYDLAIQTGLRSNEIRSLTSGNLYLEGPKPYVTCDGGDTKNSKDAKQYIRSDLAAELNTLVASNSPTASVFSLPHETDMAELLRTDLATAREQWIKNAEADSQEHSRRRQSDFLAAENHDGQSMDFHALRHTCGAWLAMSGSHPKAVQQIMRHSTITLTMDTYGHLFPGQESEAVENIKTILVAPPEVLTEATAPPEGARELQQNLQQSARGNVRRRALRCDQPPEEENSPKSPKTARKPRNAEKKASNRGEDRSSGRGIRTPDTRIMIPLL